jgi:hypothetical protein
MAEPCQCCPRTCDVGSVVFAEEIEGHLHGYHFCSAECFAWWWEQFKRWPHPGICIVRPAPTEGDAHEH